MFPGWLSPPRFSSTKHSLLPLASQFLFLTRVGNIVIAINIVIVITIISIISDGHQVSELHAHLIRSPPPVHWPTKVNNHHRDHHHDDDNTMIIITMIINLFITRQSTLRRRATTGPREATPAIVLSLLSLGGGERYFKDIWEVVKIFLEIFGRSWKYF